MFSLAITEVSNIATKAYLHAQQNSTIRFDFRCKNAALALGGYLLSQLKEGTETLKRSANLPARLSPLNRPSAMPMHMTLQESIRPMSMSFTLNKALFP